MYILCTNCSVEDGTNNEDDDDDNDDDNDDDRPRFPPSLILSDNVTFSTSYRNHDNCSLSIHVIAGLPTSTRT